MNLLGKNAAVGCWVRVFCCAEESSCSGDVELFFEKFNVGSNIVAIRASKKIQMLLDTWYLYVFIDEQCILLGSARGFIKVPTR